MFTMYDEQNVRYRRNGARRCAECYRQRSATYVAKNRYLINARKRAARATQKETVR